MRDLAKTWSIGKFPVNLPARVKIFKRENIHSPK
jgi:hypothetical protein